MFISIIIAVILDFLIGDPYSFPHPVKLMGNIIKLEEKLVRRIFNTKSGLKVGGFFIVIVNIVLGFFVPFAILKYLYPYKIIYMIVNTYLIYTCIAARCLHYEAMKVSEAIDKGIIHARKRLSYIVGRDTTNLKEEEIIRATVETVAENTSDGVIAPLLYIMVLGVPGGLAYKFINTMDSMLGYKNEKYGDLGYFPAKVDDVFNFIPARLTGLLMALSSLGKLNVKDGFKVMIRDRKNHKSPNAAYPEGAIAGLLDIQLGGDNYYHGKLVKKPTIGDDNRKIRKKDIKNTIDIMYRSEILMLIIYIIILYLI